MESLGDFLEPLGAHLGALEGSQAVSWVILEVAGRILGPLGALSEPLGEVFGASWERRRSILDTFFGCLGMLL